MSRPTSVSGTKNRGSIIPIVSNVAVLAPNLTPISSVSEQMNSLGQRNCAAKIMLLSWLKPMEAQPASSKVSTSLHAGTGLELPAREDLLWDYRPQVHVYILSASTRRRHPEIPKHAARVPHLCHHLPSHLPVYPGRGGVKLVLRQHQPPRRKLHTSRETNPGVGLRCVSLDRRWEI
jgi:hypothetical protein